ncbi:hypothetical protein DFH09DRAFT_1080894 [Mycena vulgaris]|nr:hypothetical protein DFH09DRAFT_1080894 [Mycena vulgaris]
MSARKSPGNGVVFDWAKVAFLDSRACISKHGICNADPRQENVVRGDPRRLSADVTDKDGNIIPRFSTSYVPGRRGKADDLILEHKAIVLDAAHYFEAAVLTIEPCPAVTAAGNSRSTLTIPQMLDKSWKYAVEKAAIPLACTAHGGRIVTARRSRIRGDFVADHVRPQVQLHFGFLDDDNSKTRKQNKLLYTKLITTNRFTHKVIHLLSFHTSALNWTQDIDAQTKRFESAILIKILAAACFGKGCRSMGIIFEMMFMPISLEMIAFTFAAVQFCIEEWATGRRLKVAFDGSIVERKYAGMLLDVKKWADIDVHFNETLRTKWAKKLRNKAGVDDSEKVAETVVTPEIEEAMRGDIVGRTGETDSEAEEGDDDDEL